ncbi:MAG: hypothetical protein JWN21_391 [Sphingomonas bacterium]|nr:hypothetical protein [Sphingomonas bacterium]
MAANTKPVTVACMDLKHLTGYFRSIGLAVAIQGNTRAEWKDYDESTVLNIAYGLVPWMQKPGTVEVSQNWGRIRKEADERGQKLLLTFLDKLATKGPAIAYNYAAQMQGVKQQAILSTRELFKDVGEINREIAGLAGQGARRMADIQLGATLLLAGVGCAIGVGALVVPAGTALAATGVGLGYNIAGTFIKDAGQLSDAGAVAIQTEVGKASLGTGMDASKGIVKGTLASHADANTKALEAAQKKVAEINAAIERKRSASKIAKLTRKAEAPRQIAAQAGKQLATNKNIATAGKVVSKGVPIVFFAHDVWNAYSDWADVYEETR